MMIMMHKWVLCVSHSFQITCACRSDVNLTWQSDKANQTYLQWICWLLTCRMYITEVQMYMQLHMEDRPHTSSYICRASCQMYTPAASLVYLRSLFESYLNSSFHVSAVHVMSISWTYMPDKSYRRHRMWLCHMFPTYNWGDDLFGKKICSALSMLVTCNYIYRRNMCMSMYIIVYMYITCI